MNATISRPTKAISAVQVTYTDAGGESLGLLTQLPRDSGMTVVGDGFNDRTIKVSCKGTQYFVFREDVDGLLEEIFSKD